MVTIARICAYFTGGLPQLIIKLVRRVRVFGLPRGSRRAVEKWGILMFSGSRIPPSAVGGKDQIEALGQALEAADAVIIGAGAGLSASAGLTYDGERVERDFSDFQAKYGLRDM